MFAYHSLQGQLALALITIGVLLILDGIFTVLDERKTKQ